MQGQNENVPQKNQRAASGRNAPILHRFANEDVTLGAWLVGLEVAHIDERRLCCDSAERCAAQVRNLALNILSKFPANTDVRSFLRAGMFRVAFLPLSEGLGSSPFWSSSFN